jgi:hypothetical protein
MTPLEAYYAAKKKQEKPSEALSRQAAIALLGKDPGILMKKSHPGFFMNLLDILDRPGNATRALLVGKLGGLKGMIPFAGVLEDLTGLDLAMNPDQRVPGTEIIDKWFGKQPNRPGKIDMADALGMVVEIAADPLWLLGPIGGLTKVGKAKGVVESAIKAAAESGKLDLIRTAIRAAKAGTRIPELMGKSVANALRTVYEAGTTPKIAKTWAEQAAHGERAVLTIAGKPVYRGGKTLWNAAEASVEAMRKSYVGEKFLAATHRVAPKYDTLHPMHTTLAKDIPAVQAAAEQRFAMMRRKELSGIGVPNADDLLADYIEASQAKRGVQRAIEEYQTPRLDIAGKRGSLESKAIHKLAQKRATLERNLVEIPIPELKDIPMPSETVRYKSIPPDVSATRVTGQGILKRRLSRMENELNRLKYSGRHEDIQSIQRLDKITQNLRKKLYRTEAQKKYFRITQPIKDQIAAIDREMQQRYGKITRSYTRAVREDTTRMRFIRSRERFLKQEAEGIQSQVPGNVKHLFDKYADEFHKLDMDRKTALEAAGVPIDELTQPIGHIPRVLTADAREFIAQNKERFNYRTKQNMPKTGFSKARSETHGWMTRKEVDAWFRNTGYTGEHVFEPGVIASNYAAATEAHRAIGASASLQKAIRMFSKPETMAEKGDVPLIDFLTSMKVRFDPKWAKGRVIPQDIVGAYTTLSKSSGGIDPFWKMWTSVNRFMKGAFTLPFPSYYAKNVMGDMALGWLDDVKNPARYWDSWRLISSFKKTEKIALKQSIPLEDAALKVKWPKIKTALGDMNGWDVWKRGQQNGVPGQTLGIMHVGELPGGEGIPGKNAAVRFFKGQGKAWDIGRETAKTSEDWTRMAHFVDKLNKGFSPADAATRVKNFHFDYGDLSEFEKRIMRDRMFFYYVFSRKNLPRQLKSLAESPAKMAAFSHLAGGTPTMQGEGQYYPDWWQEQLIVKTPFRNKDNQSVRMMSTGLPIEEAFSPFSGEGVGFSRVRRILARNIGRLTPLISKPIEATTGKSLYFDKPITNWNRWMLEAGPAGRAAGTVRTFANPIESVPQRVMAGGVGLRTRAYDPEKMKQYKIKEIARKYLATHGGIASPTFYVKKENRSKLSIPAQISLQVQ